MGFLSKLLSTFSGNEGFKVSEQLLFDKTIGFRGIVPGVGTSTLLQNTAIALSQNTRFSICVLDTAFLYPTLYPMLVKQTDQRELDFLSFERELTGIAIPTAYHNVSLVSLANRTIIDMLSAKDSELVLDSLIGTLKSYFDIILVDLAHEPTNIATHAALKCNRVIHVADYSLKCIYNLQKSINTLATLGVPPAKADKVVLNKVLPDVLSNIKGAIESAGLSVLGEIPHSLEIARLGVAGKKIYTEGNSAQDIYFFSSVIDAIVDDCLNKTPLNSSYFEGTDSEEGFNRDSEVDQIAPPSLKEGGVSTSEFDEASKSSIENGDRGNRVGRSTKSPKSKSKSGAGAGATSETVESSLISKELPDSESNSHSEGVQLLTRVEAPSEVVPEVEPEVVSEAEDSQESSFGGKAEATQEDLTLSEDILEIIE